jgi:predicted DNA-binding transcriptional regulator AlpA
VTRPPAAGGTWTGEECAEAWGVKTPTWLGYVSRGQAPAPLPDRDGSGRRRWDADEVRRFPRPGAGRSRAGATAEATELLDEMREVADQMEQLRATQRTLLQTGKQAGLEILAMARALGISRQTAYSWLATDDERTTRSGSSDHK